MSECRLDRVATRGWARVSSGWMIEAIGCGAVVQATVCFHMRDPRCLRNKATCCANPVLYFSISRHNSEFSIDLLIAVLHDRARWPIALMSDERAQDHGRSRCQHQVRLSSSTALGDRGGDVFVAAGHRTILGSEGIFCAASGRGTFWTAATTVRWMLSEPHTGLDTGLATS